MNLVLFLTSGEEGEEGRLCIQVVSESRYLTLSVSAWMQESQSACLCHSKRVCQSPFVRMWLFVVLAVVEI